MTPEEQARSLVEEWLVARRDIRLGGAVLANDQDDLVERIAAALAERDHEIDLLACERALANKERQSREQVEAECRALRAQRDALVAVIEELISYGMPPHIEAGLQSALAAGRGEKG